MPPFPIPDPIGYFRAALLLTGVAHTGPELTGDPALLGKRLGCINGASWIAPWSYFFGRVFAPGAHLVNVGNEAVQINFMTAHQAGRPVPPQSNIDRFVQYARDLVELSQVDAILITCSTMNRAYRQVETAVAPQGVPVIQIDLPMMERAVQTDGKILVIATHGPTVASTQKLLNEAAERLGRPVSYDGVTVEEAWHRLAQGDVAGHNQCLAEAIQTACRRERYGCVVLAQLSMSAFIFSYPEPETSFGLPVFTSGQCGFERAAEVLRGLPRKESA